MIPYNTDLQKLVLPEYGRLVQDMVFICCDIEDRESRNAFAANIVETMKSMTQEKGKLNDDRKYWDHLFVISDYKIDVDSPFGCPEKNVVNPTPQKVPYSSSNFGRKHYGNILQRLIKNVAMMPNSEEKDACVELLANHIKKLQVVNNDENAGDELVYSDLSSMSGGSIQVEAGIFTLPDFQEEKKTKTQKKKKSR